MLLFVALRVSEGVGRAVPLMAYHLCLHSKAVRGILVSLALAMNFATSTHMMGGLLDCMRDGLLLPLLSCSTCATFLDRSASS